MIKRFTALSVLLVALASPAIAADAPAAAASNAFPPAVVAVVDIQKILHESTAAKGVREQLASRRTTYQQQVTADGQKLRDAEKELVAQRSKLSAEEFAKKRTEFETKVNTAQQGVQERGRILDAAFNQALDQIRDSMGQIVAEAAKARGVTMVVDKAQVIVVESKLDITATVLEQLNKKLPKVEVKLPPANQTQSSR